GWRDGPPCSGARAISASSVSRAVVRRTRRRVSGAPRSLEKSHEGIAMKTTIMLALAGALLGAIVASFIVPPALAWYTSPGGLPQGAQIQAVVQIPEVIRYATSHLLRGQAIGAAIGAALGAGISIFMSVPHRRQQLA